MSFKKDLEALINRHSCENGSDTPDFILATYLDNCLLAYEEALHARENWYGRKLGHRPITEVDDLPADGPPTENS